MAELPKNRQIKPAIIKVKRTKVVFNEFTSNFFKLNNLYSYDVIV